MTFRVPWWLKLGVKLAMGGRVPYRLSNRLGIGRHGAMEDAAYAWGVVRHHLDLLDAPAAGFTALELGPGDSLLGAYFATAAGATETWLIDTARFASYTPAQVEEAAALLEAQGSSRPIVRPVPTPDAFLAAVNGHYLTDGLASLRSVPDTSVDVAWSHAVLEHVRRDELPGVVRELRRILKPDGRMSHVIDFEDHLSAGFQNLRFSSRAWERPLVWRSGCYTNRLGMSELTTAFEEVGFEVRVSSTTRRSVPDGTRRMLATEFRDRSDDDLSVASVDLLASIRCPGTRPDPTRRKAQT